MKKIIQLIKNFMANIKITAGNTSVIYNGNSVTINNGRVIIDGNDVTPQLKNISISIEGDINELKVDACNFVKVNGVANNVTTTSGDIQCGSIGGNVQSTSGDIECADIAGNVNTVSGDVEARKIYGKVSTVSGDIDLF